jgi:sulfoxide reductase catalytic subunit YedY
MLVKRSQDLKYSEITPHDIYLNRRKFLYGMGLAGGLGMVGKNLVDLVNPSIRAYASTKLQTVPSSFSTTETVTPAQVATTYNNYYEFGTDKQDPAKNAQKFVTSPWSVSVEGEVAKPRKFTMDEILKLSPLEERIYRHRCVEAWSIVVPWIGYSFSALAKLVEPTSNAKYVAFESYFDKKQMPLWSEASNCPMWKV